MYLKTYYIPYIHIYTCGGLYTYRYIDTCMYVHVYICACFNIYIHRVLNIYGTPLCKSKNMFPTRFQTDIYVYIDIHVCIHVSIYGRVCACINSCVCVRVCKCRYAFQYI